MKSRITKTDNLTPFDRVRLHLRCPWRTTHEAKFHIAGILREFRIPAVEK